eukprot:Seg1300.8 transcript_id=Seg1300.8/GoldUCD/mRNA.D3Y31 product="hypothetical protein" protein_id=Seg1300.8/GoldUCD/D3Y31
MIKMILYGSGMGDQTLPVGHQEALTISQLIRFNCRRNMVHVSAQFRHEAANETPLPLYIGVMLHSRTRRRELIDAFFQLGLSISYSGVLQISIDLGNAVCEHFNENGVICPPQLKQSLFTTAAVDNIDHNPSSTTSVDSVHGTAFSLSQHPQFVREGLSMSKVSIKEPSPVKQINQLPESCTVVPQIAETFAVSPRESLMTVADANQGLIKSALEEENDWMHKIGILLEQGLPKTGSIRTKMEDNGEILSWGAYHSRQQRNSIRPKCYTATMPLFYENAHTASMIRHSMTLVNRATEYLYRGQTPVIVFDLLDMARCIWRGKVCHYVRWLASRDGSPQDHPKAIGWKWVDRCAHNCRCIFLGKGRFMLASFSCKADQVCSSGNTCHLSKAARR